MILLLGADSYVGQAFARALRSRKDSFIPLSRQAFDYSRFEFLFDYVRKTQPQLVINAAEHSGEAEAWSDGRPDETAEDTAAPDRLEMLQVNVLLPQTIARVTLAHDEVLALERGAELEDRRAVEPEDRGDLRLAERRPLRKNGQDAVLARGDAERREIALAHLVDAGGGPRQQVGRAVRESRGEAHVIVESGVHGKRSAMLYSTAVDLHG